MKKLKGLVLLLVVGMAITGCYMTPDMGDVELSLVLPKTLLEKTPPGSIMKIALKQQDTKFSYDWDDIDEWTLPVPSYNPDPDKKSSGVLALKVPIGINYQIHLEISVFEDGALKIDTTGTSGFFNVCPYTGNVKVTVELSPS